MPFQESSESIEDIKKSIKCGHETVFLMQLGIGNYLVMPYSHLILISNIKQVENGLMYASLCTIILIMILQ